jgi:hypothetical protein
MPNETATCVILRDLFRHIRNWRADVEKFMALRDFIY